MVLTTIAQRKLFFVISVLKANTKEVLSRSSEPLDLVHTDVCGKLNTKSLGGAEYFLTFIDDHTQYVWIYFIKSKAQVFKWFVECKTMIKTSTDQN